MDLCFWWSARIFLNQTNRNASKLLCKFSRLQHVINKWSKTILTAESTTRKTNEFEEFQFKQAIIINYWSIIHNYYSFKLKHFKLISLPRCWFSCENRFTICSCGKRSKSFFPFYLPASYFYSGKKIRIVHSYTNDKKNF